jgi:hypothetical protein
MKNFVKNCLINVSKNLEKKWEVEGILKNRLNEKLKFDLRPLKNHIKIGYFNTTSDKIVFDINNKYIILDVKELHEYLKSNNIKEIHLLELLKNLHWNIVINK